jgi:hypothetical protein
VPTLPAASVTVKPVGIPALSRPANTVRALRTAKPLTMASDFLVAIVAIEVGDATAAAFGAVCATELLVPATGPEEISLCATGAITRFVSSHGVEA